MSADTSGRYKSRLFNLLNRQYLRWAEKGDRAFRHFQIATTWGTQVLLYPVYALFQSARLAVKQLKQAVQRGTTPQPQSLPATDAPIQQVLETAQALFPSVEEDKDGGVGERESGRAGEWGSGIITNHPLPTTHYPLPITGIATLQETGNLVLVASQNQIVDILTPEQQQELHKQITYEIANYWHQRRLIEKAQRPSHAYLAPPKDRANLFLPVRLFRQVMFWVQTGPVASMLNLFEEDTLLLNLETKKQELILKSQELKLKNQALQLKSQKINSPLFLPAKGETGNQVYLMPEEKKTETEVPLPTLILTLDRAIANLEAGSLVPVSEMTVSLASRGQQLLQLIRNRVINFYPIRENSPPKTPEQSQHQSFNIQALIRAAVNYFFGERHRQLSWQEMPAIGSSHPLEPLSEEDPWLTQNDLFGASITASNRHETIKNQPEFPVYLSAKKNSSAAASLSPAKSINRIYNTLRNLAHRYLKPKQAIISKPKPQSDLVVRPKTVGSIHKVPQKSTKITKHSSKTAPLPSVRSKATPPSKVVENRTSQTPANLNPTADRESPSLPASDWIETKAKPAGYVKHPLELVLEWLDRMMLWLEELLITVWKLLRQHLIRKK